MLNKLATNKEKNDFDCHFLQDKNLFQIKDNVIDHIVC